MQSTNLYTVTPNVVHPKSCLANLLHVLKRFIVRQFALHNEGIFDMKFCAITSPTETQRRSPHSQRLNAKENA